MMSILIFFVLFLGPNIIFEKFFAHRMYGKGIPYWDVEKREHFISFILLTIGLLLGTFGFIIW